MQIFAEGVKVFKDTACISILYLSPNAIKVINEYLILCFILPTLKVLESTYAFLVKSICIIKGGEGLQT